MSNAPPVLDYANPLPAQPVTSDIVVEVRADGMAFLIPPATRFAAHVTAAVSTFVALLLVGLAAIVIGEWGGRWHGPAALPLLILVACITALLLFTRLAYRKAAHGASIWTQDGSLHWRRPTMWGCRERGWPAGAVRSVYTKASGRSIKGRMLGDLYISGPARIPVCLFVHRDLEEMRWLEHCLRRLVQP